jgi:hypothetical protein
MVSQFFFGADHVWRATHPQGLPFFIEDVTASDRAADSREVSYARPSMKRPQAHERFDVMKRIIVSHFGSDRFPFVCTDILLVYLRSEASASAHEHRAAH